MTEEIKQDEPKQDEKRYTVFSLAKELRDFKAEVLAKIEMLEKILSTPQEPAHLTPPQAATSNGIPIPLSWRDIVNTTLNKEFGIEVEYMPDTPKFQFTIIVPQKYSNMKPTERQLYGNVDRRLIVLDNAVGENGVRMWSERVFKNLGPEIQAMLVNDRVTSL